MWKLNIKSMAEWMRRVMLRKWCAFTLLGYKRMEQDSGMDHLVSYPKVYLGLPSGKGLWNTITHPVQGYSPATHEVHISTRVLPWGHRVWQQSWPLLLQMQVCLPAAKAEGLHPGWHQHRLQKCPQHCPLRGSSHCTYSLQSWVTGYKDSVQFDVTHLTRHSKQEYRIDKMFG